MLYQTRQDAAATVVAQGSFAVSRVDERCRFAVQSIPYRSVIFEACDRRVPFQQKLR